MYKIVRYFRDGKRITIHTGLTLQEAQEHCRSSESSSKTATSKAAKRRTKLHGEWFDGYTEG